MKLKLFLIAASAMALATSCSSDEVVQSNENANVIKFSVVANNGSRAADYWCNSNKPNQFKVWAKVGTETYFEGESYTLQNSTYNTESGVLRYWPMAGTGIEFFAAKIDADKVDAGKNVTGANFATFNWNNGVPTMEMTVKQGAKSQNDLLYAYAKSKRGEGSDAENYNNGVATLNFRHALSQVVFQAKNENKNIYVKIDEVQICNINSKGVFTFPTAVTTPNLDKETQNSTYPDATSVVGCTASEPVAFFTTETFDKVPLKETDGLVNLTNNRFGNADKVHDTFTAADHSLLLIPQTVTAWDGNSVPSTTGAYFKVKCSIQNVPAGNGSDVTNTFYLWGGETTKFIYIPVNVSWKPGKKYIYTFKFTKTGNGGKDENGKDVLIPITFDLTVDDFVEDANQNVDANV